MDKIEVRTRKGAMFFILSIFLILSSGCETVKGAFQGAKKDWQSVKEADARMRKSLW